MMDTIADGQRWDFMWHGRDIRVLYRDGTIMTTIVGDVMWGPDRVPYLVEFAGELYSAKKLGPRTYEIKIGSELTDQSFRDYVASLMRRGDNGS